MALSSTPTEHPTTRTQITASLTDQDIENAEAIFSGSTAKNKAQALSIALSLTRYLMDQRTAGGELLLRSRSGAIGRVKMKELQL